MIQRKSLGDSKEVFMCDSKEVLGDSKEVFR